jgi:hypothetical protein
LIANPNLIDTFFMVHEEHFTTLVLELPYLT